MANSHAGANVNFNVEPEPDVAVLFVSYRTRRASEMALPERPMQPFIFNSSRCYAEDPDDAAAYRIEDLQGAFVSLVLGLSLSLAGFMTEIFLKKTQSIDQTSRAGDQGGPKVGNHFDAS